MIGLTPGNLIIHLRKLEEAGYVAREKTRNGRAPPGAAKRVEAADGAWQADAMIDEFAKEHLHDHLRWVREALVWKLDGLCEYDMRRPLTAPGQTSSAWSRTWRPRGGTAHR